MFHRDLVLLNVTSVSKKSSKSKDIVDMCIKQIFDTSDLFIQSNIDSYFEHIAGGGVNIYLYVCISPLVPVGAVHVWACL